MKHRARKRTKGNGTTWGSHHSKENSNEDDNAEISDNEEDEYCSNIPQSTDDYSVEAFEPFFESYGNDFAADLSLLGESSKEGSYSAASGAIPDQGLEEMEGKKSLEMYPLGGLPSTSEKNVPQGKL